MSRSRLGLTTRWLSEHEKRVVWFAGFVTGITATVLAWGLSRV